MLHNVGVVCADHYGSAGVVDVVEHAFECEKCLRGRIKIVDWVRELRWCSSQRWF
jgi:hypothetical protein